jgi:hypothetical protein
LSDRIGGEEDGSFIKGLFFGFIICVCVVYLALPEAVIENASKVFFLEDSIHCKKRPDLGDRVMSCNIGFKELRGLKKIFCYSKGEGMSCQVHANESFETPGYLKDLYFGRRD